MAVETLPEPSTRVTPTSRSGFGFLTSGPIITTATICLTIIVVLAIIAPWIVPHDPMLLKPAQRLKPASAEFLLGTDAYGRDVLSRILYGGRISLLIGLGSAIISIVVGLVIGLVSGFFKWVDAVMMRIMDGLMAIPGVLLAIALMAVMRASLTTVIIAIMIPEIPRVVRLVRSVVLTLRELPFVEAAVVAGTRLPRILGAHILPNTLAPLIVQATYICASAIIIEAALSFLGAGTPPEVPSWGNIMAEGRGFFLIAPWLILFPGIWLTLTVLAINLLGDGLRDMLDPRLRRRM